MLILKSRDLYLPKKIAKFSDRKDCVNTNCILFVISDKYYMILHLYLHSINIIFQVIYYWHVQRSIFGRNWRNLAFFFFLNGPYGTHQAQFFNRCADLVYKWLCLYVCLSISGVGPKNQMPPISLLFKVVLGTYYW